ncbi:MAG: protein kinase domain-containing protein [Nesterenkonia sp.]
MSLHQSSSPAAATEPWGPAGALAPPQVPGLTVLRLLGVGGRAAVWLVRPGPTADPRADSGVVWVSGGAEVPPQLALKVPLERPRTVMSLRSGREELEAMIPLSHNHVVRPWGLIRTSGVPGVLMDAYPAGSLAQLLRSLPPLDLGAVVTALTPVGSALEHLHRLGACHGDVSAANILLSYEGRPVLSDLGDAALLGMESAHGSSDDDVAALAAVAWELLTGQRPDQGPHRAPLGALQPDLPLALAQLLEDCLGAPPGQRPSAEEFAVELYGCAEPTPLRLAAHVDDDALAELPTQLPQNQEPGPSKWAGLLRRLGFRSRDAQRPSWASKLPSSKRAFRVWRKRPASAPSTIR